MQQDNGKKEAVLKLIREAFGGVTRGKGLTLHQGRALDDYEPESVVAKAASKDPEKAWTEILVSKVIAMHDTLAFLDNEGFRFAAPAFMSFALDSQYAGENFADSIMFFLLQIDTDSRRVVFNKAQLRAIAAFLRYMLETYSHGTEEDISRIEEYVASSE